MGWSERHCTLACSRDGKGSRVEGGFKSLFLEVSCGDPVLPGSHMLHSAVLLATTLCPAWTSFGLRTVGSRARIPSMAEGGPPQIDWQVLSPQTLEGQHARFERGPIGG